MLCKEIGRPGMQPSFRQEDARIFTGHMEMGAKGSSSQMSPSALPRSLRMRLPSEIRPGRGDGWGGVLSQSHRCLPRLGSPHNQLVFSRGTLAQ